MTTSKKGLLLINLGTPAAPEPAAVRSYLGEFLMDPHVIDLPWPARWLLVHGVILRLRPKSSAELYRKIWTPAGSPLLLNTLALASSVRAQLGPGWVVETGMRYGNPSIADSLTRLRDAGAKDVLAIPLFPQYSGAATATAIEECRKRAAEAGVAVRFIERFHDAPGFVRASAEVAAPAIAGARADAVVFSFHGLPKRQVAKSSEGQCKFDDVCCAAPDPRCYRAQCYATARALAGALGVTRYRVAFQSRLGRAEWIKPYLDDVLAELRAEGAHRIAVLCPSFVSDCLETLEEIGIRARETFREGGGEELTLIPSLNAHPTWVNAVAEMAQAQVNS